ncbi:InlB B-repeat-containing protein [Roseibacillus persicicus]|uniref:InlB B-repeat-containing protein n=1 Tax=Roseibacillus persicicus TaxID=454148 RepID=UPI0016798563|nr:hypothetical protein [Roseibacillus persicicus]
MRILSLRKVASLSGALLCLPQVFGTRIESATPIALPAGETITLTGSGLANTTKATFFYTGEGESAFFTGVSDTTVEVVYTPSAVNQDNQLFIETASGSTLTSHFHGDEIREFTGTGPLTFSPQQTLPKLLVVKSGAVFQGLQVPSGFVQMVYVESGGAITGWSGASTVNIFAEDGALLDFRTSNFSPNPYTSLFYSPATQILGTMPTIPPPLISDPYGRQTTSISLSVGVGPFTKAFGLEVEVVGDGSVTRDPAGPYYQNGDVVELTAEPGVGGSFNGWTGGVTSNGSTISVTIPTSKVTANFSTGRTLSTYSGAGGSILKSPDLEVFADGATVTLTPQAVAGFEFLGWGGDVSGTDNPLVLTMSQDLEVIGIFQSVEQGNLATLSAVDLPYAPLGETITLTGSGLTNPTAASFLIHGEEDVATTFSSLSDLNMEVVFNANAGRSALLVETGASSTLAIDLTEAELGYFQGQGSYSGEDRILVVAPGSVLDEIPSFHPSRSLEVIYVRAGAIFRAWEQLASVKVFAEQGAVLDFREGASPLAGRTSVYYSPATEILGEMPVNVEIIGQSYVSYSRQLTPISLSPAVGTFGRGYELEVEILGNGTVSRDLDGPYYPPGVDVELTAISGEGSFFTGWSGGVISEHSVISVRIPKSTITASFSSGRKLTTFSGLGGSILRDPDLESYPDGAVVTLTPQPASGYEFVSWGGEADSSFNSLELTLNSDVTVVGVFRLSNQDSLAKITSSSPEVVPVGSPLMLEGEGFVGPATALFLAQSDSASAASEVISQTEMEVMFQSSGNQPEMLLVETANGTSLAAGSIVDFEYFEGVGALSSSNRVVVVQSGSILESVAPGSAFTDIEVYYVKAGAVFKAWNSLVFGRVFAEDGAILDLRDSTLNSVRGTRVFYGPGVEVLGDFPGSVFPGDDPFARQTTSLSLSPDVGLFESAYTVAVTSEGPGTVTVNPDKEYYTRGETVTFTAVPDEGNYFIRWNGNSSVTNPELTFTVSRNLQLNARFSPLADFVSSWRLEHFSPEQLADPNVSGLSQDPDGDGLTNTAEYVFGSDPLVIDSGADLRLHSIDPEAKLIQFSYLRPKLVADVDYLYFGSTDFINWNNLSEGEMAEEVATEDATEDLERVTIQVSFGAEDFPKSYTLRLGAELL